MDIFLNQEKRTYLKLMVYYCKFNSLNQENIVFYYNKALASHIAPDKLQKVQAKFLVPTFVEHMEIQKKSIFQTSNGAAIIHEASYKENILRKLLKKIITEDYELEINEDNFGQLHPLLGDALFKAFEEAFLYPSPKEDEIL